jgi:hypothetical protein
MRVRRGLWVVLGAGALLCAAGGVVVHHEYTVQKDQRDLGELTFESPWPRDQLRLPDELPRTGVLGEVNAGGLELDYGSITYRIDAADLHGEPDNEPSCGATAILTCTGLGPGLTLVRQFDTCDSCAATGVRWWDGHRFFWAHTAGDHPELVDRLRRIVTETHRPTDAELLRALRPPGYKTDWS